MASPTQPLHDEHRQFSALLEAIRLAANPTGAESLPELRSQIDSVYAFLVETFLPHAHAEEVAVYPLVARALGAPQATATMAWDHAEVGRLTQKLAALRERLVHSYFGPDEVRSVRTTLYDLHALLEQHVAKEEGIYFPLLDRRVSPSQAIRMTDEVRALEKRATALAVVETAS